MSRNLNRMQFPKMTKDSLDVKNTHPPMNIKRPDNDWNFLLKNFRQSFRVLYTVSGTQILYACK